MVMPWLLWTKLKAVSYDLDLSNRAFLVYESIKSGFIGKFDAELLPEFFRAVAFNAGITLHLVKLRGENKHHIAEAALRLLGLLCVELWLKMSELECLVQRVFYDRDYIFRC